MSVFAVKKHILFLFLGFKQNNYHYPYSFTHVALFIENSNNQSRLILNSLFRYIYVSFLQTRAGESHFICWVSNSDWAFVFALLASRLQNLLSALSPPFPHRITFLWTFYFQNSQFGWQSYYSFWSSVWYMPELNSINQYYIKISYAKITLTVLIFWVAHINVEGRRALFDYQNIDNNILFIIFKI